MAKTELMGVETARKTLGQRIDMAEREGVHSVITKHGRPAVVLVPMEYYRRMRELDGDPTDL